MWDAELYASDYFEQLYEFAELLVNEGKAYVDSQTEEQIRENARNGDDAGNGQPVPRRARVEENLDLLRRMKAGEFPDGAHVLRAKIDMAHPNMIMRDPLLLRIRHARTTARATRGASIRSTTSRTRCPTRSKNITHSLCTLEFKDNNDIYRWLVHECGFDRPPEQTEFARLELDYTVLSKRKLLRLVNEGFVSGWDDPRMPTIAGMRRRGVTPEGAARLSCETTGVARKPARTELADVRARHPRRSQHARAARDVRRAPAQGRDHELSRRCSRDARCVVLPARRAEDGLAASSVFARAVHRARRLHGGSAEEVLPPRSGARSPAALRLLRHVYGRGEGRVRRDRRIALHVRSGDAAAATRRTAARCRARSTGFRPRTRADCELRLYDKLFRIPDPDAVEEGKDFLSALNPESLVVDSRREDRAERGDDPLGSRYQFERTGYFVSDPVDSRPGALVFNRTVTLRDSWAKIKAK